MASQRPRVRAGGISFRDYTLEDGLRRMAAVGYDGVEIWKPQLAKCQTPEMVADVVAYAKRAGVEICAMNDVDNESFRPYDPNHGFERTLAGLKENIDLTHLLGVRDLLVWEGVRPKGNRTDEVLAKEMSKIFSEALAYAASYDVRILIEPHPFSLGMNLQYLVQLCDSLDSERFGIVYDSCHFGVGKPDGYIDAIATLGKRIKHIHFSDSDMRTSELHYPVGKGKLDIDGMVEAFRQIKYDGTISLDTFGYPLPEETSKIGIPPMKAAMQKLGFD